MKPALNSADAVLHALRKAGLPAAAALETDSRRIRPGDVFLAWPGVARDPRQHLADAFARGAAAAVIDADGGQAWGADARVLHVQGLQRLAGAIAAAWYGHPSQRMRVLAITGTNGKTSCALWLAQALRASGRRCGVIGTLGAGLPGSLTPTGLTTPDPVRLQRELSAMQAQGVDYCAIEASSIGIEEHRMDGLRLYAAAFTNLSQDHLDYHGDMVAYAAAKHRLFECPGLQWAVLNQDDAFGVELARHARQRGLHVLACGGAGADWMLQNLQPTHGGMRLRLVCGGRSGSVELPVVGPFNAANALLVAGLLHSCGLDFDAVLQSLSQISPPPGRMQALGGQQAPLVVVDYAHTPDALAQALAALRPLAVTRGGRLWCVFGAGGDRDPSKRAAMAAAVEGAADIVVLTSDNPRSEAPQAILDDLLGGLSHPGAAMVLVDRAQAIAQAVAHAAAADVVLLAGKGHESTQECAGRKLPFNDVFHARAALAARGAGCFDLRELQTWVGGRLHGDAATPLAGASTDTRKLEPGQLFIALRGERFDANALLGQAAAAGAAAVLAESHVAACGLPGIEVDSSLTALGQLARAWRRQQPALPLIAVAGSNGKTTVTQMLASILAAWHGETGRLATAGNFNNEVGLPLTLLRLRPEHLCGVVELGMNHVGEVERLAAIAEPTVALVNNAQREHQEFMKSVEAVARENGAVLQALPEQGWAVFPAADDYSELWRALAGNRPMLRFALHETDTPHAAAEVCGRIEPHDDGMRLMLRTPRGEASVKLQLVGRHNAHNALAASACAIAAGAPLEAVVRGLEDFRPVQGRMQRQLLRRADGTSLLLIDDSYNANPDSVRAAIDALAQFPGRRLLLLGDMGEVGDQGPAFHAEVGRHAAASGIDALWCVGALSAHAAAAAAAIATRHAPSLEQLELAAAGLRGFDTILVKGSRFMRMERAIPTIKESLDAA